MNTAELVFDRVRQPKAIAEALAEHGAVLIRNAVPTGRFQFWKEALKFSEACDGFLSKHDPAYSYNGDFCQVSDWLARHGIKADIEEYRSLFSDAGLRDVAANYFSRSKTRFLDLPPELVQRRIRGLEESHLLGFHMDLGYIAPFDEALTIWMPFHDVDPDRCASLQVIAKRIADPVSHFGKASRTDLQVLRDDEVGPDLLTLALPTRLTAGDVFMFTERTLHRTFGSPKRTEFRYSLDFRYAAEIAGAYPFPNPPLIVEPKGGFVARSLASLLTR